MQKDKIVVSCNRVISNKRVLEILQENIHKLEKKYKQLANKKSEELYEILYFGKKLPICEVVDKNLEYEKFELEEKCLKVFLKAPLTEDKKADFKRAFYKYCAQNTLLEKVEYFANLMQLYPNRVTFRRAKTRWGSCSSENNISLNIGLIMLSYNLIDYVIVHELAHIKHKNHSKEFWKLVEQFYPNYKQAKEELKKYSLLLNF